MIEWLACHSVQLFFWLCAKSISREILGGGGEWWREFYGWKLQIKENVWGEKLFALYRPDGTPKWAKVL